MGKKDAPVKTIGSHGKTTKVFVGQPSQQQIQKAIGAKDVKTKK